MPHPTKFPTLKGHAWGIVHATGYKGKAAGRLLVVESHKPTTALRGPVFFKTRQAARAYRATLPAGLFRVVHVRYTFATSAA